MSKLDLTQPRSSLEVIRDALKHDAITTGLNHVSDDVMTTDEYDKEVKKATLILKDAIFAVMRECDFIGDEAILENTRNEITPNYTCKNMMLALLESACDEVDVEINNFGKQIVRGVLHEKYVFGEFL